jgi:hypothetical protein
MAFKDVNSLPTPQPSLDSSVNQLPVSFDSVLSRLKPLLEGTDQMNGACKVTVVGVSTLFFTVGSTDSNGHSLFSTEANKDAIRLCGSADVEMMNGSIKSPDYSMYEVSPKLCIMAGWPMVIWEVAYSQDKKKLAEVLRRYVTCSAGMV